MLRTAATNETVATASRRLRDPDGAARSPSSRGEPRAAAAARAGLIATQMLGLAFCRYVLKLPPVVRLERAEIVRRIGATVQSYLYDA